MDEVEKEDMIFAVWELDDNTCWVYITDKLTWEQEKRQNDTPIDWAYDVLSENGFSEVMENVLENDDQMNGEEVILCLEQLGFVHDIKLQTFVEDCHDLM